MKKIFLLVLVVHFGFAQNLNSIKYALVPSRFSFQAEKGQFNLNNLTRMILESNAFEAYLDDENLPDDFVRDNCNKVYVDLVVNNSMFATKVKIVFKDCKNSVIFTSQEGKSAEKSLAIAYVQALQMASQSLRLMQHNFVAPVNNKVVFLDAPVINVGSKDKNTATLIAKKAANGFNLYQPESDKVLFTLKTISLNDVYIANRGSQFGLFYKTNDQYYFEYYINDKKVIEMILVTPLN